MKRLTTSVLVFGLVTGFALVTSCSDGLYEDDLDYNTSLASDTAIEGAEVLHISINQIGNDQIDNQRVVEKAEDLVLSLLAADEHPVEISLENPAEKVKMIQMDICDEDDFLTLKRCDITDRTAGFLCRASESINGCCGVRLFSLSASAVINEGSGPIVVLKYGASEDAPAGVCRALTTEDVAATDVENNPLTVISSQGEFCFAEAVLPCKVTIIPEYEEVIPGTPIYFAARGNDNCEPTCYQWRIMSVCGSIMSSEGAYQAGSMAGIDEIMLFDACTDELLAIAEVSVVVEDLDEDGITDDADNCPDTANPDQEDTDRDGLGDVCDDCLDVDQDEVCDDEDRCPDSNLSTRVSIRGCDSEFVNTDLAGGCSMNDLIGECVDEEENHGSFVSCVARLTNAWQTAGLITGKEKGAIQSCAARSDVP